MAEAMILAAMGAAGLDSILAAGLLTVYAKSFMKVRAPFTIGLMTFAAFFLAQNLLALYAYITMMAFFPVMLAPYMLGIMLFEALGLGVMLYSAST